MINGLKRTLAYFNLTTLNAWTYSESVLTEQ